MCAVSRARMTVGTHDDTPGMESCSVIHSRVEPRASANSAMVFIEVNEAPALLPTAEILTRSPDIGNGPPRCPCHRLLRPQLW